jgi:hypothetical protein
MKGREIINHAVRAKMPDREQIKMQILHTANEKQTIKRPVYRRRSLATLATAAALIICVVFGYLLMYPQNSGNFFALTAYALEQQEDGIVVFREVDLHTNETWRGLSDGVNIYLNLGLSFTGENIESVRLSVDEGFYAKQYVVDENSRDVPMIVGDGVIHLFGTEFEKIGNNVILERDTMTDNLLLFWGFDSAGQDDLPHAIAISATATFNDGKTQEKYIVLEIRDRLGMMIVHVPEGHLDWNNDPWRSIALEYCILIPESVKIIDSVDEHGVVYEFDAAIEASPVPFIVLEQDVRDNNNFDDHGVFRDSWVIDIDGLGYLSVVKRDENDVLTGMVYRVPEEIVSALRRN